MLATASIVLRLLLDAVLGVLGPVAGAIGRGAHFVADVAAAVLASDAGAFALVAATATLALLALLAVAVSLVRSPVHAVDRSAPHPRRAIHDATRLSETDPDAPGHSRPRAPGFAAPAA